MKPNWCPDSDYTEDVTFVDIEKLNLIFTTTFAGKLPGVLFKKEFNQNK
jgi:hypothetical protein